MAFLWCADFCRQVAPFQSAVGHRGAVFARISPTVSRDSLIKLRSRGWDNTSANGANLSFPLEFGIQDDHWLVGLINTA